MMRDMADLDRRGAGGITGSLFHVDASDPRSELIDRSKMSPREVSQIGELMQALSDLRTAEQALSAASQKYMQLSSQDMRALHYLIVAKNQGLTVTPGMLGQHLEISPASTTKMLNRLEHGEHITREIHPHDRRAFAITITDSSHNAAMQSVGAQHARRFHVAAKLRAEEREIVLRFLKEMTDELSLDHALWVTEADSEGTSPKSDSP